MSRTRLIAILTAVVLVFASTAVVLAEKPVKEKKFNIVLSGAFNMVSELGSDSDYVAGSNDFPVTPSFTEVGGGIGFLINFSESFGLNIQADYLMGTDVDKVDPSDGETFSYTTYDNLNLIASLMLKFGGKTKFFISGGAGLNILMPYDDKEETGSLGSIIVIEAPETTSNFLFAGGAGLIQPLGSMILKLEAQYIMVTDYEKNSIMFRVGIGF